MAANDLLEWMNAFVDKHGVAAAAAEPAVATADESRVDLQAEYDELGGDRALLKVLADQDHAFLTRLEMQRAQARKARNDLVDALEFRRHMLQSGANQARETPPRLRKWHAGELAKYEPLAQRADALGPKLETEPGRELRHLLKERKERIDYYEALASNYERKAAKIRPALAAIHERIADADRVYEAIEKRIRETTTELDNMVELKAMSVAERLACLKGGGTAESREAGRYARQRELSDFVNQSIKGFQDVDESRYVDDEGGFTPKPLDWLPVQRLLARVEETELAALQKRDKNHDRLWNKYLDAGGDDALLRKLVAEWRESQGYDEHGNGVEGMSFREEVRKMQERLGDSQLALEETRKQGARLDEERRTKEARVSELTAGAESGELLSERESAELRLLAGDLKRIEKELANRAEIARTHERAIANVKERMKRARDLYEHRIEDDEDVDWSPEPTSKDVNAMPLKVKYELLTKKKG